MKDRLPDRTDIYFQRVNKEVNGKQIPNDWQSLNYYNWTFYKSNNESVIQTVMVCLGFYVLIFSLDEWDMLFHAFIFIKTIIAFINNA